MGGEIDKVLKTFGLTDTEIEVYIFLAKHGVLKNRDIARQMKKDRGQALRILKSLQTKGLVEATLEAPTRYVAVPFEQVIDLSIKAKRDEAAIIEGAKKELLDYWKKIGKTPLEASLEKFVVIEGNRKIYPKISQMIKETKHEFLSTSTAADLERDVQFGLFEEMLGHSLKSKAQFRFITEVSDQNVRKVKSLLKRIPKRKVSIKGRNPDLGLRPFPRMVTRDSEEIMLFIKPEAGAPDERTNLCLWTNNSSIVSSFTGVFEDLWQNSSDIEKRIAEIETGVPTAKTFVISDPDSAKKKYEDVVKSARAEVVIMTSSEGLIEILKNIGQMREGAKRGVSIKIMAPITRTNLGSALKLAECCQVRHVPPGYSGNTIVDARHLFQFKNPPLKGETLREPLSFKDTFYTTDHNYVEKTKNMLDEVWKHAVVPSAVTVEELAKPRMPMVPPVPDDEYSVSRKDSALQKSVISVEEATGVITEEYVLNKIINAERTVVKDPLRDVARLYGNHAIAVVHPPSIFNLPDTLLMFYHLNKQSSFGAEDWFAVCLWLETPKGNAFVPVAIAGDNPKPMEHRRSFFAGTPAGQNWRLLKKDELRVEVHGNILFAGWTVPIPLYPPQYTLPPASVLIEGYGKLKSTVVTSLTPSGAKVITESNGFDAFVTFFHPASKYAGPGTDGVMSREMIMTLYPPPTCK